MRNTPPIGSIGFCAATGNWFSRQIAKRQGIELENGQGVSHVNIFVGEGEIPEGERGPLVWDATTPRTRLTLLPYWDDRFVEWYAPRAPFYEEEKRILRSVAKFTHDRIPYGYWDIASFVLFGFPRRRDSGLYCSEGVAEMYLTVRSYDFSRIGKPWQVDPRTLYQVCRAGTDFYRWRPTDPPEYQLVQEAA